MALSWNEIKERAARFVKEWTGTTNEDADAKPFLVDFFTVFGISRKKVASFEHRVKKLNEKDGYIDLFWKGVLLVEMKSAGKNLDKAYEQAREYLQKMPQHDLPKYILISDFVNFRLYDLEENITHFFSFSDFVSNVHLFGFLSGYEKKTYKEQDPANIKAAELMGRLHDRLKEIGYEGHPLEVYLVRLLFCLFAEDTTIFQKQQFQDFIEQRTSDDGSDLAARIQELFQVLNTPENKRFKNLDEQLAAFPYVNGKLFEEILPNASFDAKMRQALLDCCYMDWSKISPAIFGSMFQSVMNPQERRNLGAHYTSEKNILKLIKPLFLDELWQEFETIKTNKNKLGEFHRKLAALKFLDPACGCGNFLVITYRELRLLELEILRASRKTGQTTLDILHILKLDVDMMYGIEFEEFPARIAEVAMWLIDHQMNMVISNEFGQYYIRLPLKKAANIFHGNALKYKWEELTESFDFILGNPPFIGKNYQSVEQRKDMELIMKNVSGGMLLDYVAAWYIKAALYIQSRRTKVAFVSTNSISQGEQVSILWQEMILKYNCFIHFAHRTFKWKNEAKGNAGVHVVIIGFAAFNNNEKKLFEYDNFEGEAHEIRVNNINMYLVNGANVVVKSRSIPLSQEIPQMINGNKPTDGGNLLLDNDEKNQLIKECPDSEKWIKKFAMGDEFINGIDRFCLWLVDCQPHDLKKMKLVVERVENVRIMRSKSSDQQTRIAANRPAVFQAIRQDTNASYLAVPRVSSERRKYIPIAFLENMIAGDKLQLVEFATLYHFGVLTSLMHMSWMRITSGRLESRYQYSAKLTYNTFPWPNPTDKQTKAIEAAAQKVLDARAEFPESSLADLYDPLTMPPVLVKAHQALDKAVDLAYRSQPFTGEANRMEFLFALYEKYTADLFTEEKQPKGRKAKKKDA
ncbi:MAG: class I SAM-dependent DNA methyltransferase [Bacteroidota bacterium]